MIYLPDTNAWIRFLNPGENPVKDRFLASDPSRILLCSVVKAELYFGAMKSSRTNENLQLLNILVTHNTREFSRVSDLKIEDWEK